MKFYQTGPELLKLIPKREPKDHKYRFGHLLVIGGSELYSGSPAFNSLAAYRTGVDLVTTIAPERAANIIASFSPSLITLPLKAPALSTEHIKILEECTHFCDAVVIGGGLGRSPSTINAVRKYLQGLKLDVYKKISENTENTKKTEKKEKKKDKKPCVIDADGLHALKGNPELAEGNIITPHAREFEVVFGEYPPEDYNSAAKKVQSYAEEFKTTILLKGNPDIISDGVRTAINRTGNPYMTVGGTGDVLAGVLGALLAQKIPIYESGCLASYITGVAGELAAEKKGPSMMAEDVIDEIERVLNQT